MKRIFILIFLLIPIITLAGDTLHDACNLFHEKLAPVPHDSLVLNMGQLNSRSDGKSFNGCEVLFGSHAKLLNNGHADLPSFRAPHGSELYKDGWREDFRFAADGAGSGSYGIVRENILCVVNWDQHAWIDDETGSIEQSDLINMSVQCREVRCLTSSSVNRAP